MNSLQKLLRWGPLTFGVVIFAPMWAAALDTLGIALPYGIGNLTFTLVIGLGWGAIATLRGQWL